MSKKKSIIVVSMMDCLLMTLKVNSASAIIQVINLSILLMTYGIVSIEGFPYYSIYSVCLMSIRSYTKLAVLSALVPKNIRQFSNMIHIQDIS